ncbi:MAG: hypothetical protein DIZ78_04960 [endosymbiont of Escarpia spicata]|uniref:Calcineurin-like phosphoesterase domain-containing protein n=1 Tax=endosymbiont of Escarpia spicata TaxID=2200908 RepID=A0A370DS86_9GAMM|nr:MAG: hypothetical protein DIZ78_04960 [endosymbiont of Escarpia spicata]
MGTIALFSDVHGNIDALQRVLDDIESVGAERIICLGDLASYNADQHTCMELLRSRDIEWIAGNHDLIAAGLLAPLACSPYTLYSSTQARKRLKPEWRKYIRTLPLMIVEEKFCAFHGSPDKVDEYLSREERLRKAVRIISERGLPPLAFFGHTHLTKATRIQEDGRLIPLGDGEIELQDDGVLLVNVGTVGEPRGKVKWASYVLYDPDAGKVTFRRVEFDHETSWQRSIEHKWRRKHSNGFSGLYDRFRRKAGRLRHRLFPRTADDSSLDALKQRMDA